MRATWLDRMRPALMAVVVGALALAGCESQYTPTPMGEGQESTLGASGGAAPEGARRQFSALGQQANGANSIRINGFLWRAALDTVSFMPISSADPYGGAILTDWYSPADVKDERFKLNILVQGEEIRSDGVRVTVFKQERDADGAWADVPADTNTGLDLENLILVRARDLRQSFLNQ